MLVGRESACQKSLPLTEGMIHSREREREGRGKGGERGRQATEKEKNGRDKEKERERNNGAEMPVRKTNDADLRQNDKISPRWD